MAEDLGRSFAPRRFLALLCGSFAVLALVIIGAGVAGNAGMDVSARKKELAIRMAIGATRVSLVALVARRHLQPVLVGGLFGGILAAWGVRGTQAYLYEMSPYDFRVWSAAVVLVSIAALGCAVGATLKIVRLAPLIHLQEN